MIPGTPKNGTPYPFPYHSHFRIPKDMGIVWEAYHKGVPLLGVPQNLIDSAVVFSRVLQFAWSAGDLPSYLMVKVNSG